MSYSEIDRCRISGSKNLIPVLDLGTMALTGVFPSLPSDPISKGPLSLVYCPDSGLVQMKQSYDLAEMYGDNYGYRSGLNSSMVDHLWGKATGLRAAFDLPLDAVVIDVGGNDGTFLRQFPESMTKILVDPTAKKWAKYHEGMAVQVIADFFPTPQLGPIQADLISSIACFYDLERPVDFVRGIRDHLKPQGIWHFEQSYLPFMLQRNAYDTVCHEHLEFYTYRVVEKLLRDNGMKVIQVDFNQVNGGSFAVTAAHLHSKHEVNHSSIRRALEMETGDMVEQFGQFRARIEDLRDQLVTLVKFLNDEGKTVAALGASTKGNVLLQYCGFTDKDIAFVSDVNPEKNGKVTPGTNIPIVSESWARKLMPDAMIVLPWHFRDNIIEREEQYLQKGGSLIFPLPSVEIVTRETL